MSSRKAEVLQKRKLTLKYEKQFNGSAMILLPTLLIVAVFFSLFIKNFIATNKNRFETLNSMMTIDFKTRSRLNIIFNELLIVYELMYVELFGYTLSASDKLTKTASAKNTQSSLNRVYNTTNYMGYLIDMRTNNMLMLEQAIESFDQLRRSQDYFDRDASALTTAPANITQADFYFNEKGPVSQTTLLPALRSGVIRGIQVVQLLKVAEPYMIGKEPPFNLSTEAYAALRQEILIASAQLRNILEFQVGAFRNVLESTSENIIYEDTARFDRGFRAFLGFQIALGCITIGVLFYFAVMINRQLNSVLLMYQLLKVNEVVVHKSYYERMLERVKVLHLSFDCNVRPDASTMARPSKVAQIGKEEAKRRRIIRIDTAIKHTGFSTIVIGLLVIMICLSLFMLMVGIVGMRVRVIIPKEEFYIKSYFISTKVNNNFLSFGLIATLGNFIKIDGKTPEELWNSTSNSVQELMSFWLDKSGGLAEYLDKEEADSLQEYLFSDLCPQLNGSTRLEQQNHFVCMNHVPSRRGMLSYFLEEESVVKQFMFDYFAKKPNKSSLYTERYVSIRALHDPILDYFETLLFNGVFDYLSDRIRDFKQVMDVIQACGSIIILALMLVLGYFAFGTLKKDKQASMETVFTIRPDSLNNNPLVSKALDFAS